MTTAPVPSITDDQIAELTERHGIPAEALQVLQHVAGLYSGGAIKGDPTQLFITGHQVWMARQALEKLAAPAAPLLLSGQVLYQDAEGTIPVTGIGQPVGLVAHVAPVAQEPVAFFWEDTVPHVEGRRHGPYFGWPTDEALARVAGLAKPVPLYAAPPALAQQPAQAAVPEECPHMIVFDDTDREPLIFAGAGAREAASKIWAQISNSWNAHLFVRIGSNSRDDSLPSAMLAAAPAEPVAQGGTECNCPKIGERWNPTKHAGSCPVHDFRPAAQEPVAYLIRNPRTGKVRYYGAPKRYLAEQWALGGYEVTPLYTAPPAAEQPDTVKVRREVLRVLTDTAIAEWHDPSESEANQDKKECQCCGVQDGHNADCAVSIALRLLAGGAA